MSRLVLVAGALRREVIEAVAVRALGYPYRIWGFGEGMALLGLIRAGAVLDRPQWIDAVADLVAPSLSAGPDPTDHLIPVEVLVELARYRPVAIHDALARFTVAVTGARRPVPGQPPVHRPDLPALGTTIWVDCLHTDGPGLPVDAAARLVEEHAAVLQDSTGLFSHGYDVATGRPNAVHWGRGQGWALHGLAAVPSARRRLDALLTALRAHETGAPGVGVPGVGVAEADLPETGVPGAGGRGGGSWRTIVDDPGAPVEHSVSALVAACPAADPPLRRRALAAALAALDGDGGLPVSSATPVGRPSTYRTRDTGVFPWGQGPLLLALLNPAVPAPAGRASIEQEL
jgi:hypothetical protein